CLRSLSDCCEVVIRGGCVVLGMLFFGKGLIKVDLRRLGIGIMRGGIGGGLRGFGLMGWNFCFKICFEVVMM
ncbi:hypothetical protein, partial [Bacillus pumilus]|uniref:hypothetical protein n=1 Tax=Bacillus pumilus TaxID=1408 RepID=UPI001C92C20F